MKSHTLNGEYLKRFLRESISQGKEPKLVICFEEAGLEVECSIRFRGGSN